MIEAPALHAVLGHAALLQQASVQADVPTLPDDLGDVLMLAGIIITFVTSISAILSSIFIKKDNLLYLGTQLILLSFFLLISAHWVHGLWAVTVFETADDLMRFAQTMLFVSIAYTLDMVMKLIVWEGILRRNGRQSVPPILIGSVRTLIYLFAFLFIIQFVYNKSITALAALSGAFALIVGLSAQTTLGEMFAGIAIALSRPFRIGDWVKVGALDEGHVIDMTWRMVRIETRDKVVLNVPNRTVADNPIRNFSYPNRAVRISEAIFFPQTEDPKLIQDLLREAIAGVAGTVSEPAPSVLYRGAKDGVAEYSLRYYVDDYQKKDIATENVWKNVIDRVSRSEVKIAFPRRIVELSAEPVALSVGQS